MSRFYLPGSNGKVRPADTSHLQSLTNALQQTSVFDQIVLRANNFNNAETKKSFRPRRLPGLHKRRLEAVLGQQEQDEGEPTGSLGRAGSQMSLLAEKSPTRLSPIAAASTPIFRGPTPLDAPGIGHEGARGVFQHTSLGELLQLQSSVAKPQSPPPPPESSHSNTNKNHSRLKQQSASQSDVPRGPSPAPVVTNSEHSSVGRSSPTRNPVGANAVRSFPTNVAENLLPLRTYLFDTLLWAKEYTEERVAREHRLAAAEIEEDAEDPELLDEAHRVWRVPALDKSAEAAQRRREGRFQRPGDLVAHRLQMTATRQRGGNFLTQIRDYVQQVEQTILLEMEAKKNLAKQQEEEEAAKSMNDAPFAMGGVLDKAFTKIAHVGEQKFSSLATRYYYIARRHRQKDVDLRELYVVGLEKRTFRLGALMTYDEFCVVYRQFHRYANPLPYLIIAQIPRNGWMFVDKLIKTLITRKIDKNKTGKIQLPDLVKHLYPAMELDEIAELIATYEARYLQFVDKDLHMQIDQLDPDMVDHFGVVFSVVDKLGNGRILRDEFVEGMPCDPQSQEDEEAMRFFLADVFDSNCRQDMNEKLEHVGDPYLDLECLVRALSVQRYNAYGGTMMGH